MESTYLVRIWKKCCVQGILPSQDQVRPGNELAHKYNLDKIASYLQGCAMNFRPHNEQLKAIQTSAAA